MAAILSPRRRLCAVVCGGFLGTVTRVLLSSMIQTSFGKAWPFDIFLINITGALLFALVTALADATLLIGPTRRLFVTVGFLGAYTTFSSLALGDVQLFADAHWLPAYLYLIASMGGGLLAVLFGNTLGQWIILTVGSRSVQAGKKKTKELSPLPSSALIPHDLVDVQDNLELSHKDHE
jgi:CrcB protein